MQRSERQPKSWQLCSRIWLKPCCAWSNGHPTRGTLRQMLLPLNEPTTMLVPCEPDWCTEWEESDGTPPF